MSQNPFKGPVPYNDLDIIYGREKDSSVLIENIRINVLTLFYSKSGNGKSSLLQAGLIPELLKKGVSFLPIYIRLNENDARNEKDIIKLIELNIRKKESYLKSQDKEYHLKNASTENRDSLFEYLYRLDFGTVLQNGNAQQITPVLIFDQFEEIFTLNERLRGDLLNTFESILENKIPGNILTDQKLLEKVASSSKPFRVVWSFREDSLLSIENLKEKIPSVIYTNGRVRLEGFSRNDAADIIFKVSGGSLDIYISNKLATFLFYNSIELETERLKLLEDVKSISPFILSLICWELYPELLLNKVLYQKFSSWVPEHNQEFFRTDFETAIERYYNTCMHDVDEDTKIFIEEELITEAGKRKLFPYEDIRLFFEKKSYRFFKKENTEKGLQLLGHINRLVENPQTRYLNKNKYLSTTHIEILHDQLVTPVYKAREERNKILEKKRIQNSRLFKFGTGFAIAVLILCLIIVIGYTKSYNRSISHIKNFTQNQEKSNLNTLNQNYGSFPAYLAAESNNLVVEQIISGNILKSSSDLPVLKSLSESLVEVYRKTDPLYAYIDSATVSLDFVDHLSPTGNYAAKLNKSQDSVAILNIRTLNSRLTSLNKITSILVNFSNDVVRKANPKPEKVSSQNSSFTYNYTWSKNLPFIPPGILTVGNKKTAVFVDSILYIILNESGTVLKVYHLNLGITPIKISFSNDEDLIVLMYQVFPQTKAVKRQPSNTYAQIFEIFSQPVDVYKFLSDKSNMQPELTLPDREQYVNAIFVDSTHFQIYTLIPDSFSYTFREHELSETQHTYHKVFETHSLDINKIKLNESFYYDPWIKQWTAINFTKPHPISTDTTLKTLLPRAIAFLDRPFGNMSYSIKDNFMLYSGNGNKVDSTNLLEKNEHISYIKNSLVTDYYWTGEKYWLCINLFDSLRLPYSLLINLINKKTIIIKDRKIRSSQNYTYQSSSNIKSEFFPMITRDFVVKISRISAIPLSIWLYNRSQFEIFDPEKSRVWLKSLDLQAFRFDDAFLRQSGIDSSILKSKETK